MTMGEHTGNPDDCPERRELIELRSRVENLQTQVADSTRMAQEQARKAEAAVREAERSMSHDIGMRLRIRQALRIHDCAPLEEGIVAVGTERDGYRMALEGFGCRHPHGGNCTDHPQWSNNRAMWCWVCRALNP
jgi:hypothetical protein